MLLSNQNPSAAFEEGSQKAPVTGQCCGQGTVSLLGRLLELPGHCQAFWQRKLLTQTQIMKLKKKLSLLLSPPPSDQCPFCCHCHIITSQLVIWGNLPGTKQPRPVLQVLHYPHAMCLHHSQRLKFKSQVPASYFILAVQLQTRP